MIKIESEYVLFDLDGTIIESDPGITRSIKYALEKFGIESPELEELKIFVGPPLGEKFMEVFGVSQETADILLIYYRERYNTIGIFECNVYDGIKEMLVELHKKGKKLAVATSKPERAAKEVLAHFGLTDYFDFIGGDAPDHSRPNKMAVIEYVAKGMGLENKSNMVMVGDTHYDVEGAKKVGIDCIGVLYGYGTKEGLERAGACALAENAMDIVEMF